MGKENKHDVDLIDDEKKINWLENEWITFLEKIDVHLSEKNKNKNNNDDLDKEHVDDDLNISKFNNVMESLDIRRNISKLLDKELKLQSLKLRSAYKQDLKKQKNNKSRRGKKLNPTGFIKASPILRPEFANYLGVKVGTLMSGPEITKKLHAIFEERNLRYPDDKRIIRTDEETRKVFLVDKSVDKSIDANDEHGFNFGTLQFFIKQAHQGKKLDKVPRIIKESKKKDVSPKELKKKEEPSKESKKKDESQKELKKKEEPSKESKKKDESQKELKKKEEPSKESKKKDNLLKDLIKKEEPSKETKKKILHK
jgi:hypothetical protein